MSKHTPGPWSVYNFPNDKGPKTKFQIRGDIGGFIGAVLAVNSSYGQHAGACFLDEKQIQANAALIASAPELLEALEQCADWLDLQEGYSATVQRQKVQEVIAKAKGE